MVLDVGCGQNGGSLPNFSRHVTVAAVDVNKQSILKSHRKLRSTPVGKNGFHFVRASVNNLPFRSQVFDIVACVDLLEHLGKHEEAIKEMHRVSTPRGRLVGSTSNLMNPLMLFDSLMPRILTEPLVRKFAGEHYERQCRLSPRALVRKMKKAGYATNLMVMLSLPPFQRWIHEDMGEGRPWFFHAWAAFNEITKHGSLSLLKGNMIFEFLRVQ